MIGTVEEVVKEMKNGVYNYTNNGECSNCGACCSAVLPLSRTEIRTIERFIRKRKLKPFDHISGSPVVKKPDVDMTCPFRDNVNRICAIYSVRPAICANFKCDKPQHQIEADKALYRENRSVVNMWEFFK